MFFFGRGSKRIGMRVFQQQQMILCPRAHFISDAVLQSKRLLVGDDAQLTNDHGTDLRCRSRNATIFAHA